MATYCNTNFDNDLTKIPFLFLSLIFENVIKIITYSNFFERLIDLD